METLAKGTYEGYLNEKKRWLVEVRDGQIIILSMFREDGSELKLEKPMQFKTDRVSASVELVQISAEVTMTAQEMIEDMLLASARIIESLAEAANSGRSLGPIEMKGLADHVTNTRDLVFNIREARESHENQS